MNYIKNTVFKYKYYIIIFLILFILVISFLLSNKSVSATNDTKLESKKVVKTETEKIKVDIKGEIVNPGVYEVKKSSRVIDLINMAGGFKESASTEYINLSKKLKDEMTVIIYSIDEINEMKREDKNIIYVERECNCPSISNDACIYNKSSNNSLDKININLASIEELQKLSGIGESKAKTIIDYRNDNGPFKSIEDIMNVSGIGEAAYSKIKDSITI